mmetsp:Transcript_44119/g.140198  ORF Transcript_44119/g.140198 Transcript_44119/m.140198 type:complete len:126 (-) Transcript_44119:85-462(-)
MAEADCTRQRHKLVIRGCMLLQTQEVDCTVHASLCFKMVRHMAAHTYKCGEPSKICATAWPELLLLAREIRMAHGAHLDDGVVVTDYDCGLHRAHEITDPGAGFERKNFAMAATICVSLSTTALP